MIPFFGDQFRNAGRAQRAGYAKRLNFKELSTDSLVNIIQEMTTNKSYLNKAREMSAVLRDDLVHPLDKAVWWIEHVAKFRGAKYLKSHAVNMSLFSYLSLDVFGFLIFGFFLIISTIYFAIMYVVRGNTKNVSRKQKKQKKN